MTYLDHEDIVTLHASRKETMSIQIMSIAHSCWPHSAGRSEVIPFDPPVLPEMTQLADGAQYCTLQEGKNWSTLGWALNEKGVRDGKSEVVR